jgi:tRNA-Thr(GGU) m(6)t(6)A37 methyltransferase TsaA
MATRKSDAEIPQGPFLLKMIGRIHTPFREAAGTPVQSSMAQDCHGTIEVFPEYAQGLADLEGFERIWLVYWFDRAITERLTVKPYLHDKSHGIFATRAPCRPNPLGMSSVKLIDVKGNILEVTDVDILDGTPLLDIKPYCSRFDVFKVNRSGWVDEVSPGNRKADERFSQSVQKARNR